MQNIHVEAGRAVHIGLVPFAVLVVTLTTAPPVAAQMLQAHAGVLAEAPEDLPLAQPRLALDPPFDRDIVFYDLRIPHTTTGLTIVATSIMGVGAAEGESEDGNELTMRGWRFSRRTTQGGILSFDDLPVGDSTIRVGFGPSGLPQEVYTIAVNRAAEVSSTAALTALSLSSAELRPPFTADTGTYEADVPGGVTGLRVTATPWPGGQVTISGRAADGDPLTVDGRAVSGLAAGRNTITVAVTAEDGSSHAEYSIAVHRDTPAGSAALHDLRFSEGPPGPGFLASAASGALPEGDLQPTPAFSPEVMTYALDVSNPQVTIRARSAAGSNFAVAGTTADGSTLAVVNQTSMGDVNGNGAFLSVTLDGLAMGENTITLTVSEENDDIAATSTTVVVTRRTGE